MPSRVGVSGNRSHSLLKSDVKPTESRSAMDQDPYNATLVERIDFNPELAEFRVKFDDGNVPDFHPGQFATLGLLAPPDQQPKPDPTRKRQRGPKLIRRAYSIATPPKADDWIGFYIVKVDDGALTPKLFDMKPGDRLAMTSKITGHFTLEGVPDGKNLIMIGTGTGLAPYRSMYYAYRNTGRWQNYILFDGCRLARDLGYKPEFDAIQAEDPTFKYFPTVTREPEGLDYDGLRGRVTDHLAPEAFQKLAGFALSPENCDVFLCGNPQMIDQCEEMLTAKGFVTKVMLWNVVTQCHFCATVAIESRKEMVLAIQVLFAQILQVDYGSANSHCSRVD